MKKILFIFIFFAAVLSVQAQIRWPFGSVNAVTNQVNDTVDISSYLIRGINYYTITNDTNMVINVTTVGSEWKKGDLLIIEATEGSTSADTLRYGTNITGLYDAIPAGKTAIVTFIFNETAWVKLSTVQIN